MMINYKVGKERILKNFDSVQMVCVKKSGLFSDSVYNVVAISGSEQVMLYSGLKEKKAKHMVGEISFACGNPLFGGGVYYV